MTGLFLLMFMAYRDYIVIRAVGGAYGKEACGRKEKSQVRVINLS